MADLTIGSLCSGYGGLDLAVNEVFGASTAWHAETDPNASTVLAKNFPGVPNLGDITTIDFAVLPGVDILAAGFPCQPVSAAGRQKARDDHRWLWPSVLRAVAAMTPRLVVLENVQNLVSIQKGSMLGGILTDLATAGYLARWCVLGACAVGGCHHRHRFFLVAEQVGGEPVPVRVAVDTCGAPRGKERLLPTPVARDGRNNGEGSDAFWERRRTELGRINGIPLGAVLALLPTPRATDGSKRGPNMRGSSGDLMLPSAVLLPTVTTREGSSGPGYAPSSTGAMNLRTVTSLLPADDRFGQYAPAVALWEEISGRPAPAPTEPNRNGNPRLSPAFAEWMMGLPAGWVTDHLGRVPALRAIGNGVVPLQAATAIRVLVPTPAQPEVAA